MSQCIAIATNALGAPTETFVTRHVIDLNGGHSVVVCRRVEHRVTPERPTLVIAASPPSPAEAAGSLARSLWNQLRWGGIALPGKATRDAISRFLVANGVNAILAEFGPLGCIMGPSARQTRLPLWVCFQGRDASSLLAKRGVREAYRHLFRQVDGVFAVSRALLDNLAARGFSHPNSHVVPSGVDTDDFVAGTKDPWLLLSVGRFVPKKAPALVIRAFAEVARRHPVRLDMIGDGPLLEGSRRLASSLGVAERIRFMGAQPHTVVRERMARASILLQHSVTDPGGETEGLPCSIQEAMSAEAVVISTNHGGIPEAICSGLSGLLVDENDLPGFIGAITRVIEDRHEAAQMAARARAAAVARLDCRLLMRRIERAMLG
jgi:glycosyltransferase involved in cell wall biosynthesis